MRLRFVALFALIFTGILGCQSPEKAVIQPLPVDGPPLGYNELVVRGKAQVAAAHEFFYQDRWDEVRQASTALRETAGQLANLKEDALPAPKLAILTAGAKEMDDAAVALQNASAEKDIGKTTEAFRRLHLAVRQMRID